MTVTSPGERVVLGSPRCPACGRRFLRLKSAAKPVRRDCICGRRWTITFEPAEHAFVERLGVAADRARVSAYVDGRRRVRQGQEGQLSFELEAVPEPKRVTRRRSR